MTVSTHARARHGARHSATTPAALAGLLLTLAILTAGLAAAPAAAKSPGARYCFGGVCHRVMTLSETRAVVGRPTTAVTSFYDDCRRDPYNPCGLTSSGEAYRPGEANSAASPLYPDGTIVVVRNPRNGESAVVRINNAGPYWGNRTLDLSRAAGVKLGLAKVGVAKVEVTVLKAPNAKEARYRRNRVYPSVPGHVGRFASMGAAQMHASLALDLDGDAGAAPVRVAELDPRATPASTIAVTPLTGPRPQRRRLPPDVVRVSAAAPGASALAELAQPAALAQLSITHTATPTDSTARPLAPAADDARLLSPNPANQGGTAVALAGRTTSDIKLAALKAAPRIRGREIRTAHVRNRGGVAPVRVARLAPSEGTRIAAMTAVLVDRQDRQQVKVLASERIEVAGIATPATRIALWAALQESAVQRGARTRPNSAILSPRDEPQIQQLRQLQMRALEPPPGGLGPRGRGTPRARGVEIVWPGRA